jgi:parallel beta-helix repeat protein
MSLCINPHCSNTNNPDNILFCQACGSELLLEGRYRVMKQLGGGGFGKTYTVNEARSNILKVLKVLINYDPKAIELFQREAEVLKLLQHPGIPKVESDAYFVYFPRDSQQPLHCLVMEKIEGLDLYEYMKQRGYRPINPKLAVQWLTEIVTILQQVHSQNFFHRDIKPSNIMLRADGSLVLIDFGTARSVTATYMAKQSQGQVTGVISAGYTPMEQINGQAVPQSDFFALGRTFVYLLTAREPTDPAIYNVYTDEVDWRSCAANIIPKLADLIDKMIARFPQARPANTQEILQSLAEINKKLHSPQAEFQPSVPPTTPPPTPPKTPPQKEWTRRRFTRVFGFGSIGLAAAGGLTYTLIPKDIIVSSSEEGNYKTISEAISNAKENTRILVRRGEYRESLIIDKPLEIIGDGSKEDIIIESTDSHCIQMKTDSATVRGLTLRGRAGQKNKKYFAVDIPQGELILEDCDITSDSLSCLAIHGDTANPTIRRCKIHDGNTEGEGGVFVFDNGKGIVEDCNIVGSRTSGVEIKEGGNPTIRRCKIHDGKASGVFVQDNGKGRVEDCDIFNNALHGVSVKSGGNPTIRRCKIHDGKEAGVLVYDNGEGTVEDCEIFGNALSGVESREGGNPTIRRCNINRNKGRAVYVHDNGRGTVENCDLTDNRLGAFNIDSTSNVGGGGNKCGESDNNPRNLCS